MRELIEGSLTLEYVRQFADGYVAAWNAHDAAAIEPMVTEDIVWFDPALPEPARGFAEVRRFMEDTWHAFPDLQFDQSGPTCISIESSTVTVPWRMIATHLGVIRPAGLAPTNRKIDIRGIDVWEFRGERIATHQAYWDINLLARQIGALPGHGTPGERAVVLLQRLQAIALRRFT
jgi:steroid delta-isomerase-like uncharacterized protein